MIYIPLWLKVYLLYLWKQEALQEGKTALFVLLSFFFLIKVQMSKGEECLSFEL